MEQGSDIDIEFNGDLRQEQKPIEEIYLKKSDHCLNYLQNYSETICLVKIVCF